MCHAPSCLRPGSLSKKTAGRQPSGIRIRNQELKNVKLKMSKVISDFISHSAFSRENLFPSLQVSAYEMLQGMNTYLGNVECD